MQTKRSLLLNLMLEAAGQLKLKIKKKKKNNIVILDLKKKKRQHKYDPTEVESGIKGEREKKLGKIV